MEQKPLCLSANILRSTFAESHLFRKNYGRHRNVRVSMCSLRTEVTILVFGDILQLHMRCLTDALLMVYTNRPTNSWQGNLRPFLEGSSKKNRSVAHLLQIDTSSNHVSANIRALRVYLLPVVLGREQWSSLSLESLLCTNFVLLHTKCIG